MPKKKLATDDVLALILSGCKMKYQFQFNAVNMEYPPPHLL
jgi:hypothetical protein